MNRDTTKQDAALRLMKTRNGVTVDQITKKLKLQNERQARGLIDRLRAKKEPIKNVGRRRFQVVNTPRAKSSAARSAN